MTKESATDALSVLVFEDDIDDFYILKTVLFKDSNAEYRFEHATNLNTGFQILDNTKPHIDIILLDLNLEDSSGLDTLSRLQRHEANIPVIVLTGLNAEEMGRSAIQLGAEDYIPKAYLTGPFVSRAISYAIERNRLREELKRQADLDALTQIPNRSALFKRLDALIEQSKRHFLPIALMMIDLDGFKGVNDNHGHPAGDELLRQVAHRLGNKLRKSDMVARLGGDEFVLLLTNYKTLEEVKEIAKDKLQILQTPFELTVHDQTISVEISASIGVVEWHKKLNAEKLLSIADNHMYQSKQEGKARICLEKG